MKGDQFQVGRGKNGRWYWCLEGHGYPSAPIACSRPEGYQTKNAALRSIKSAQRAMADAGDQVRVRLD